MGPKGERLLSERVELRNMSDEIVEAIRQRDSGGFALLMARKDIDINGRNFEGITPLMAAVIEDRTGPFSILVADERIDVDVKDQNGHTALWHAINLKRMGKKIVLMNASQ